MTDVRPRILERSALGSLEPLAVERERYAGLLGTAFIALDPRSGGTELALDVVSPLRVSAGQESFSLEFLGPVSAPLGQGTQTLEGDGLGIVALFLVPLGIDDSQVRYEAVFTRLVEHSGGRAAEQVGRQHG